MLLPTCGWDVCDGWLQLMPRRACREFQTGITELNRNKTKDTCWNAQRASASLSVALEKPFPSFAACIPLAYKMLATRQMVGHLVLLLMTLNA